MNSWDHFQIPKPFSRAVVLIGNPIFAEPECNEDATGKMEAQIQQSLEELRDRGDRWWGGEPDL